LLPCSAIAQQPSEPGLTLRTTARTVVLDVIVTDKSGKPVRNLHRSDFALFENEVPQQLASFEAPADHVGETTASPSQPERPVFSGSAPVTILLLDEQDTEFLDLAYGREMLKKYLRAQGATLAQPTALLVLTEKGIQVLHDYTREALQLEQALAHFGPEIQMQLITGGQIGAWERLGLTLDAIDTIAAANAGFRGRKNLIWFGQGFPNLNGMALAPQDRSRAGEAIRMASALMQRARIALYTVDVRGLEVTPTSYASGGDSSLLAGPTDAEGELLFEQLAPATGGQIYRSRNDLDVAISEAQTDGAEYYTISYYPTNTEWDGRFRRVRVQLRDTHLTVRTREGYFAVSEPIDDDKDIDRDLSRALRSPVAFHGIEVQAVELTPTQVKASVTHPAPDTTYVSVTVNPQTLSWTRTPEGKRRSEVTLVNAHISAKGQVMGYKVHELESLDDLPRPSGLAPKPVQFIVPVKNEPQSAALRIVVRDANTGQIGTTEVASSVTTVSNTH
jgi:VWFA-related protein